MSAELLNAIGSLVTAVAWPLVGIFLILVFVRPLRALIETSEKFSITGPNGVGIAAERKLQDGASALVTASGKDAGGHKISREEALAQMLLSQRQVAELPPPLVLWVDDHPSNNTYVMSAMETLGISFVLSTSTIDALRKLERTDFDVIISDVGRGDDQEAGLIMLRHIRSLEIDTPVVFFAGRFAGKPANIDRAIELGAAGCTNRSKELIELVLSVLRTSAIMTQNERKTRVVATEPGDVASARVHQQDFS